LDASEGTLYLEKPTHEPHFGCVGGATQQNAKMINPFKKPTNKMRVAGIDITLETDSV
jgi:hypothetical protein